MSALFSGIKGAQTAPPGGLITDKLSIEAYSVDPEQTAPIGAV